MPLRTKEDRKAYQKAYGKAYSEANKEEIRVKSLPMKLTRKALRSE